MKAPIESKRWVLNDGSVIETIKSNLPLIGRDKTPDEVYQHYKRVLKDYKMKNFSEWFNPALPEHMDIACYLYKHGHWPVSQELEELDQSNRHMWVFLMNEILAEKCIKLYEKNRTIPSKY